VRDEKEEGPNLGKGGEPHVRSRKGTSLLRGKSDRSGSFPGEGERTRLQGQLKPSVIYASSRKGLPMKNVEVLHGRGFASGELAGVGEKTQGEEGSWGRKKKGDIVPEFTEGTLPVSGQQDTLLQSGGASTFHFEEVLKRSVSQVDR